MTPSADGDEAGGGFGNDRRDDHDDRDASSSSTAYRSRKPKWWTRLSGRRGTRAQRKAIARMTERGYCLDKDVLSDFARLDNRRRSGREDGNGREEEDVGGDSDGGDVDDNCSRGEERWRRAWWDRCLGIAASNDDDGSCRDNEAMRMALLGNYNDEDDSNRRSGDEKYADKLHQMIRYSNPLPRKRYRRIWIEVGFGNGENLLANARSHPEDLFVGCEIHQPGIGTLARRMEEELGLLDDGTGTGGEDDGNVVENDYAGDGEQQIQQRWQRDAPDAFPCSNVRVVPGDGIKLLRHLPSDYLDAMLVTFPDPWPKAHQSHWRVVQGEVVREMRRALKKEAQGVKAVGSGDAAGGGAGRVYVATDAECFDAWTREVFAKESVSSSIDADGTIDAAAARTPATTDTVPLWREVLPCPDRSAWLPVVSYYEQKGIDEGRSTMLQCWELVGKT